MKRNTLALLLICFMFLLVTLVGCKGKKIEEHNQKIINKIDEKEASESKPDKEKIMRDFKNIVKSKNEPIVIIEFIDKNIHEVSKEDAAEMIKDLEQIQKQFLENYSEELFLKDYQEQLINVSSKDEIDLFFNNSDLEKIEDIGLKELMEKIINGKYKLVNMEGSFYPTIDYEGLKVYNKHITAELQDYIEVKSIDSKDPTILDASLLITFDQLADRIIKTENYIRNYPDSISKEEMLRLYGGYLKLYMEGVDNTPIYDYETGIIIDQVLESYKKTSNLEDPITSDIITKYMDIIEENELQIDETIFSQITVLYNQAIGRLEDYK